MKFLDKIPEANKPGSGSCGRAAQPRDNGAVLRVLTPPAFTAGPCVQGPSASPMPNAFQISHRPGVSKLQQGKNPPPVSNTFGTEPPGAQARRALAAHSRGRASRAGAPPGPFVPPPPRPGATALPTRPAPGKLHRSGYMSSWCDEYRGHGLPGTGRPCNFRRHSRCNFLPWPGYIYPWHSARLSGKGGRQDPISPRPWVHFPEDWKISEMLLSRRPRRIAFSVAGLFRNNPRSPRPHIKQKIAPSLRATVTWPAMSKQQMMILALQTEVVVAKDSTKML